MDQPQGLVYLDGYIYAVSRNGGVVHKINATTNEVRTLAGVYSAEDFMDGLGSTARFYYPSGITTDGEYLYVADNTNHSVRRIDPDTGNVRTLFGSPGQQDDSSDEPVDSATIRFPLGIHWMNKGLFISTVSGVFLLAE